MAKLSKDILDEIEVENALKAFQDRKELQSFMKGERRENLLDIAAWKLNVLKADKPASLHAGQLKQGEQREPFTQQTHEFKGSGVEGTKSYITGADIVREIDKADEKKALDRDREAVEQASAAEKAKLDGSVPRDYVTAEDVIKKMRAEGKQI